MDTLLGLHATLTVAAATGLAVLIGLQSLVRLVTPARSAGRTSARVSAPTSSLAATPQPLWPPLELLLADAGVPDCACGCETVEPVEAFAAA